MKKYYVRSTLFNIAFYGVTAMACIACLPTLIMPRNAFLFVVKTWLKSVQFLERTIMGLRLEIRGLDNLPKSGCYIVAAKHQSAYETMKLHTLFGDPAIILKQELLKIPLWGAYLKKSDVIAIDRSTPDMAIASIQEGAQRMQAQGRPIIIFPQGTRVKLNETTAARPYKIGVARIQEAIKKPIIPMALNTGYFWPKKGWLRKPGTVIFEFLPPIEPGLERGEILAKLDNMIENKSHDLMMEAVEAEMVSAEKRSIMPIILIGILALLFTGYGVYWHKVADAVKREHSIFLVKSDQTDSLDEEDVNALSRTTSGSEISGFPGKMKLRIDQENIRFSEGRINIKDITAKSWPFPAMPVHIETGPLTFQSIRYPAPFNADTLNADIIPYKNKVTINHLFIQREEFQMLATGTIEKNESTGRAHIDIVLTLKNFESLTAYLYEQKVLDSRTVLFANAGLKALETDGVVTIPLISRDNYLYAGPFLIAEIPLLD
jgi:1-acyl-sn-glycerol-3-phosphate acyltransferase